MVKKGLEQTTLPFKSNSRSFRVTKDEAAFAEVVKLFAASRKRAFRDVNTNLMDLYWRVGEIISRKIEAEEWGDGTVARLVLHIARTQPGIRSFSRANLFRLKQLLGSNSKCDTSEGDSVAWGSRISSFLSWSVR